MTESERVIRELYEITSSHKKGLPTQLRELLSMGCKRFGLEIGILSNIVGDRYRVVHQVSPESVQIADNTVFDLSDTYCATTIAADKPVFIEHAGESTMCHHPAYAAFALESYIGIPVRLDGDIYGTLNFSSRSPKNCSFSNLDIDVLKLMAVWIECELNRIKYQQKVLEQAEELAESNRMLLKLAKTDGLTQVSNRYSFFEELNKQLRLADRIKIPLSVILLDVDNFKQYNDTYGHVAGDNALIKVSRRVSELARSTDYVARYGGEEFIVLLPNTEMEQAICTAERYRTTIEKIDTLERRVSCSFGVSTYHPADDAETDFDALIERMTDQADKALYYSKHHGRNCVNHYTAINGEQSPPLRNVTAVAHIERK